MPIEGGDEDANHEALDDAAAFAELRRKQEELHDETAVHEDEFKVHLIGGPHAVKKGANACLSFVGRASGQFASEWCSNNGMHMSATFTFGGTQRKYEQDDAGIMARAWCHRLQFCFNRAIARPGPLSATFSGDELKSYLEPTEFSQLLECAILTYAARKRCMEIRSLCT